MRARITRAHVVHARAASSQPQAANTNPRSKTGPTHSRSAQKGFDVDLVCPICLQTEFKIDASTGPTYRSFPCSKCKRTFTSSRGVPDLTLTSGIDPGVYKSESFAGQDIFRNPLVSFIYERGWRQGFKSAGFPGADEELKLAMEFLTPAFGEVLLDLSCGSGLFTRRFVASDNFSGVIGADYSESMLQQTKQLFNQDQLLDRRKLALVRADVARLPFATGSLAAIHAGAAIHCWPDPTAAMVEISRVLRPGGAFVASTFLKTFSPLGELFGDDTVRPLNQLSSSRSLPYRWWEEQELRDLTASMGLQNFQRHRQNRFIMFAICRKRFHCTVRASVGPSQGMGVSPELKSAIDKFIADSKIVLFMKGNRMFPQCGFSNTCVQILNTLSVPYETVNILEDELLRTGMKEYSQWPTFPQVYIDGDFYGGCDIMIESYTNGELKEHLEAALNS
ncbi:hypothetical protein WJX82_003898 [Trebouxia sp. C0006]